MICPRTIALFLLTTCWAHGIDLVEVGDPGNPPHPITQLGRVDYHYQIGRTEVTNEEYVAFLNAVASKTDPHGLFHPLMSSSERGGVRRNGEEGNYRYTSKEAMDQHPVTFLSWYQAARFVNWLHHGKGDGDTENGAYHLQGATNGIFTRESDARFWIPNSHEWYKAAYYDPAKDGAGGYWQYPTRSDTPPNALEPNATDSNSANLLRPRDANVHAHSVGSYPAAISPYKTHDQAGNLMEYSDDFEATGDLLVLVWGGDYAYGAEHTAAAGKEANPAKLYPSHHNDSSTLRVAAKADLP